MWYLPGPAALIIARYGDALKWLWIAICVLKILSAGPAICLRVVTAARTGAESQLAGCYMIQWRYRAETLPTPRGHGASQSGHSIGQFSQSQDGGEDMSHVGLMNTKEKRQTWLQAIYKCPLCLVSGCPVHRFLLVHFSHCSSYWLRQCIVIVVTLSLTWHLWYNRVTDILSLESLGTSLFTHSI